MRFVLFKFNMNPAKRYFCSFRNEWLSNDKYKDWIVKGEDELSCKCKVCNVSFTIKHDGVKAVNKLLNIMFHAPMGRFKLELLFYLFFHCRPIQQLCFFPVGLSLLTQHFQRVLWVLKFLLSPGLGSSLIYFIKNFLFLLLLFKYD